MNQKVYMGEQVRHLVLSNTILDIDLQLFKCLTAFFPQIIHLNWKEDEEAPNNNQITSNSLLTSFPAD
jgi:hypothetical protein